MVIWVHGTYHVLHIVLTNKKIVGNSFQPIGGLVTENCIHQGFRQKVTVDIIGGLATYNFLEFSDMNYKCKSFPKKLLSFDCPVNLQCHC